MSTKLDSCEKQYFLTKANRYWLQDVLLGKLSIHKIDEASDQGKRMLKIIEFNKIAFPELILSIDVKTSNGKIALRLVKGCKSKDYPDGNAATAWERLKNTYEPISAPSMAKLQKHSEVLH
jgi:hypothetical protein